MKLQLLVLAFTAGSASAAAFFQLPNTIRDPAPKDEYASGAVHMGLRAAKESTFSRQREAGAYDSTQYQTASIQTVGDANQLKARCVNGKAAGYSCKNIDLYDYKSHSELGSQTGEGSSSWGWTSPEGREIMVVAQADGAAFAEITKEGRIVYLGRLPRTTTSVKAMIWREIRVYDHYAVIGSEAEGHHIQIFDLTKLLKIDPKSPVTFDPEKDVTGLYKNLPVGRTHNIVINQEKKYAVAVGAVPRNTGCAAGLIFIDLTDPSNPTSPGCAAQDGYVHDAQCLVYRGPDKEFNGRDICYGYNEDTLTIFDVTSKTNTTILSRTSYDSAKYTHQGWVLDPQNQEYLILDDEYDEYDKAGIAAEGFPITYIWDIKSLRAPKLTGYYKSGQKSIDHNQYIANGLSYQSNYAAGLRILDISSIPQDPTGKGVKEIGFFDVYPEDDNTPGLVDFVGSWSSYGLFKSGYVAINSIERGLFVVKLQKNKDEVYGQK
ncbi:hypothetical protein FPQ18DRAFT_316951 [Pyronema domesticum]|uniref:Uncharacterized protein n=1 Tax=Pyronema omphalodes (strain CBS 100304) TaxID=1076935 RepID=U4LA89_PYROM|nr:hypothetical protein FPQ18DRAFT_316951 [Pyronema domesticum]CCX16302.1 Similar to hypothetical protein M7I_2814 [Glarea lozoyensis 74030]; acc. no. EHL01123 [Pyronema omphalodes CBS 100304]